MLFEDSKYLFLASCGYQCLGKCITLLFTYFMEKHSKSLCSHSHTEKMHSFFHDNTLPPKKQGYPRGGGTGTICPRLLGGGGGATIKFEQRGLHTCTLKFFAHLRSRRKLLKCINLFQFA